MMKVICEKSAKKFLPDADSFCISEYNNAMLTCRYDYISQLHKVCP